MMLLGFLLLPVALSMGRHVETQNYALTIEENTLKEIRIIGKSPDDLNLSNLDLKAIDKNAFVNLSNLKTLNLGHNSLKNLPAFVFANLTNLENLNLANNDLSSGKFYSGLSSLKTLNISNNPLRSVEPGDFFGLTKSVNILTQGLDSLSLTAAMFENPSSLISRPPAWPLDEPSRMIVALERDVDIVPYFTNRNPSNLDSNLGVKACIEKGHLKSVETYKKNETLPKDCQHVDTDGNTLSLSRLGIRTIEKGWYRLQEQNPTTLFLGGNKIEEFTKELLNDLPASIVAVYLAGNKIQKLKRGVIENKNPIVVLDLSHNRISEIEDGALENLNLTDWLGLHNNRLEDTKFLDTLPSNIQTVSLNENRIKELSVGNFSKFTQFNVLKLKDNQLREIKAQRLRGFSSLTELSLTRNNLVKIESGAFQDLKNLLTLDISENEISSIDKGMFSGLDKINRIQLDSNKLKEIPADAFTGMSKSLQVLSIQVNEIESLMPGTFVNVPKFELDLSMNNISMIKKDMFNIPDLKVLVLDANRLTDIEGDTFEGLPNLNVLSLTLNKITTIKKGLVKTLSNLYSLKLTLNPIRVLENGSLFGLPKIIENTIGIDQVQTIQGGVFEDV